MGCGFICIVSNLPGLPVIKIGMLLNLVIGLYIKTTDWLAEKLLVPKSHDFKIIFEFFTYS